MGKIDQRVFVVIYTHRQDMIRIGKPTNERSDIMKTIRITVDPSTPPVSLGWIDSVGVDATDIAKQQAADEGEAMQDAAKFARRVRRRLGLSQAELSRRIDVSIDTIRNWEQGKRCPTGAAKALLKVLDRAPETSLAALY